MSGRRNHVFRTRRYAVLMMALLTVFACKTKKKAIEKPIEKTYALNNKVLLDGILANQLAFKTFNAKAKSAVSINKDVYDATLSIRIKNDAAIWISITTLFGIEAARVLITPERFKMMNRLNGTYIDEPFHVIHRFAGSEISFDNLQAILVGNMISQALTDTDTAEKNSNGYALKGQRNALIFSLQTNEAFKITTCELHNKVSEQSVHTQYADFETINEQPMARSIGLKAHSKALALDLQLKYNRIRLNEALEMPFTIPSKYKMLHMEALNN